MSLSLRFLGTSASRPTIERNVTSLVIVREGETLMFDCGEGTQRQMMRYGVSFSLQDIFFTHFHADHILGVIGLFRTLALQGREEPIRLWGPRGAARVLKRATEIGVEQIGFPVQITELQAGDTISRRGYSISAFGAEHGPGHALGFALVEQERLGRFNPDLARDMGIPEGPLWGRLHRGLAVTLDDGQVIEPSMLVGGARPGRKIAISGDTRPCDATVEAAMDADVLVHEATFGDEEAPRALETGHSTAREAASVALRARARRLVLTHLSARYSGDASELSRQAREVFPEVAIARDGMEFDVPFTTRESGVGSRESGVGTPDPRP
ncbi:MAG: ribonuclease Z [Gemmatimonadaceae bacterium]